MLSEIRDVPLSPASPREWQRLEVYGVWEEVNIGTGGPWSRESLNSVIGSTLGVNSVCTQKGLPAVCWTQWRNSGFRSPSTAGNSCVASTGQLSLVSHSGLVPT